MKAKERQFYLREQRVFSEAIKRKTVKDIEAGRCTILQASRELNVSSTAIYKWLKLFSRYLEKKQRMVVEDESEAYRSSELEKKVKELERIIGQKQMEIDLLNKIIELASGTYKTDLKKNLSKKGSSGSGSSKA